MKIKVLFFAKLREVFGTNQLVITFTESDNKVSDVLTALRHKEGVWAEELNENKSFRIAVNQEMVAEDDEQEDQSSECHEHIDPELKKKCLQAQDLDKLFTLNINTYKVCQLNTILSTLGLRLEPKE